MNNHAPSDSATRKGLPVTSGVIDYFPKALLAIAEVSRVGNDQHNPGQPLHWNRSKSADHADCIGRHLIDRGKVDSDGLRHSARLAWRALALLELELEHYNDKKTAMGGAALTVDKIREARALLDKNHQPHVLLAVNAFKAVPSRRRRKSRKK